MAHQVLWGHVDAQPAWQLSLHTIVSQTGLDVLRADGKVFQCYNHIHLTMFHSELGASKAILDAGYNIDSLMMRCAPGVSPCGSTSESMRFLHATAELVWCSPHKFTLRSAAAGAARHQGEFVAADT